MAIYSPEIYTGIHNEEVKSLLASDEEAIKKLVRNSNFLLDLIPLGKILFVNVNQLGNPVPDNSIWQICDGTEITLGSSPLRSIGLNLRYTPDLRNKTLRCAASPTFNLSGGNQTFDFEHSHFTGNDTPSPDLQFENGSEMTIRSIHSHTVNAEMSERTIDFPRTYLVVAYMKIS